MSLESKAIDLEKQKERMMKLRAERTKEQLKIKKKEAMVRMHKIQKTKMIKNTKL